MNAASIIEDSLQLLVWRQFDNGKKTPQYVSNWPIWTQSLICTVHPFAHDVPARGTDAVIWQEQVHCVDGTEQGSCQRATSRLVDETHQRTAICVVTGAPGWASRILSIGQMNRPPTRDPFPSPQ